MKMNLFLELMDSQIRRAYITKSEQSDTYIFFESVLAIEKLKKVLRKLKEAKKEDVDDESLQLLSQLIIERENNLAGIKASEVVSSAAVLYTGLKSTIILLNNKQNVGNLLELFPIADKTKMDDKKSEDHLQQVIANTKKELLSDILEAPLTNKSMKDEFIQLLLNFPKKYWKSFCEDIDVNVLIKYITDDQSNVDTIYDNVSNTLSTGNIDKDEVISFCYFEIYAKDRLRQGNYKTYTGTTMGMIKSLVGLFHEIEVFDQKDKLTAVNMAQQFIVNRGLMQFEKELFPLKDEESDLEKSMLANGESELSNYKNVLMEKNSNLKKIANRVVGLSVVHQISFQAKVDQYRQKHSNTMFNAIGTQEVSSQAFIQPSNYLSNRK